ncbi:MAG: iron chelate uptake ABC transporter family permease subunit [Rhodobacterales bacterium]|nr:iron chelate uptake ABC transporter family permease subunit [Rhodobacterales bacterium]MDX5501280.1 iron chelate uptake ABC transporter family permease subunit [Rhodobacterales bacterium]
MRSSPWKVLGPGSGLVGGLAIVSLFLGVSEVTPAALLDPARASEAWSVLAVSRVPRTVALLLAGAGLSVAGLLLQMLVRNRFVEPATVGTTESATLGMLLVLLLAPGLSVPGRMLVTAGFAMAGTGLFLLVLRAVPLRSVLMVPLIGILLSGVIGAVTTFIAWRTDMLQPLGAWTQGDFSVVLRGRYELLWIVGALVVIAALAADRFTVAGLGRDFATGLGLNHRRVMVLGLTLVSVVSAAVLVTVGTIPFLGLIVPNIAALWVGDNMRRALPLSVLGGMALVLACDIFGRWILHPYELPIGATMGVIGSMIFLTLLLRRHARVG